jgi:small-conductance mechanosensitive channel
VLPIARENAMLERGVTFWQGVLAVALVVLWSAGGLIADRVVATKLARLSAFAHWEPTRVTLAALRGMIFVLLTLIGLRAALVVIVLRPRYASLFADILLIGFILAGTVVLARLAAGFVGMYLRQTEGVGTSRSIFANLTKILVMGLGVLVIFQSLGISITPALTALGVGGLAVALALQDTLSNVFAGLHIIASKQVTPGDYVKLTSGEEGYVTDINWRNTTILLLQNNMVIVPNSRLASTIVTNCYRPAKEMAVLVEVRVSYDSDLARVEAVTVDVAKDTLRAVPGGVSGFEPFIRYHTFGSSSVDFTVILRVREFVDQFLLKHEFIKRLHERYRAEGICIPFPARTLYLDSPSAEAEESRRAGGQWVGDAYASARGREA